MTPATRWRMPAWRECWLLRGFEEFGDLAAARGDAARQGGRAHRALALDPGLAEGHSWSGVASLLFDWDWDGGRGVVSARGRAPARLLAGAHLVRGVADVARAARRGHRRSERAAEIDPLALTIHAVIGQCHHYARRFDEALARHRATLELDPDNLRALLWSARTYRAMGRPGEALPAIERAIARWGGARRCSASWGRAGTARPSGPRHSRYSASWRTAGAVLRVAVLRDQRIYGGLELEDECRRGFERMEEARSGIIPFMADPGVLTGIGDRVVPGSDAADRGGVSRGAPRVMVPVRRFVREPRRLLQAVLGSLT